MAQRILFVQGGGAGVHERWDDKLVKSLEHELGNGYAVRYPRMPNEANPHYPTWKTALLRELDSLGNGVILVGHSVGGTIAIHALAEQTPKSRLAGLS